MNNYPYRKRHQYKFRNMLLSMNYDLLMIEEEIKKIYDYYNVDEVSLHVIALEDRRFFRHGGVDLLSVLREALKCIMGRKHGGASTIDMQLVRTLTGFREKTLYRKIYEIVLSVLVNYKFTKKQILACYLKHAFFGSKLIGVDAAASAVFNKPRYLLSAEESAFIAAMLLRPMPLNRNEKWREAAISRARYANRIRFGMEQRPE